MLETGLMRMQLAGLLDTVSDSEDFEEAVTEFKETSDAEAAAMFEDSDFLSFEGDFLLLERTMKAAST